MRDKRDGLLEKSIQSVHVAPFSLVPHVTQGLQAHQLFNFCSQRFLLFARPGVESWEEMNQ